MGNSNYLQASDTLRVGVLGGFAGGLAEIAWIWTYGALTGAPLLPVARGIVESTAPQLAAAAWAPALGIVIHLGLAVLLGIGLAIAIRQLAPRFVGVYSEYGVALLVLLGVWSVNFLVVLPYLNPGFVDLLPYSVTLLSKLMFGLAAAATLRAYRLRAAATPSPA
ncbi:MAG: hypothetical protein ACLGHC_09455 [Alphaproteobacteria bacterium]